MTTTQRLQILGLQVLAIVMLAFAFIFSDVQKAVFAQTNNTASDIPITDASTTPPTASTTYPTYLSTDDTGVNSIDTTATTSGITRVDFQSSSGSLIQDADSVKTNKDVDSYIRGVLASDTRVSAIVANSTSVTLSADNEPARLFGIVSTTIPVTLAADSSGHVTVSHPQSALLVTPTYDDELKADAESRLAQYVSPQGVTPHTKAEFILGLEQAVDDMK